MTWVIRTIASELVIEGAFLCCCDNRTLILLVNPSIAVINLKMFLHLRMCFDNNFDLRMSVYLFEVEQLLRQIAETATVTENIPFSAINNCSLFVACWLMSMTFAIFKLVLVVYVFVVSRLLRFPINPLCIASVCDHIGFRKIGSTRCALVYFMHTVCT